MEKQVSKHHYHFHGYMTKQRWTSVWHQLDELVRLNPKNVLEIGPGTGLFKGSAKLFGFNVETLDLDPELNPDYVGSATDLPFESASYDVVCAFQMLEHLPFDLAMQSFREMIRVASKFVIVSLPNAMPARLISFHIPKIGRVNYLISKPFFEPKEHFFDGEHYWEINKKGYELNKLIEIFEREAKLIKNYRVLENPYHHFFIFQI